MNLTEEAGYSHHGDADNERYVPSFASLSRHTSRYGTVVAVDKGKGSKERELLVQPPSLPPLIQALVGNLDEHSNQKQRSKVIHSKTSILPGSIVRRMKYYQEEWEEALRWISKWSQQEYHGVEAHSSKGEQSTRKAKTDIARGQYKKDSVQKCLKRCEQKHSLSLSDEIQYYHESNHKSGAIPISLFQLVSIRYHTFLRVHLHILRNIFGIVFSTVVALFVKNVSDGMKLNRYTLSLQELLLEESETNTSSMPPMGKVKNVKRKSLRHGKNRNRVDILQNNKNTEDECGDSEDSDDDSIERLYVLNSKSRKSPSKGLDSKVVQNLTDSSTNVPEKGKQPKEARNMERESKTKKLKGHKNLKRNQKEISSNKHFSQSELDRFVHEMALYQSRQVKRILNDEISCERAGKLSHLLLSDLHTYYQIEYANDKPKKIPNRIPPGFVPDAQMPLKNNVQKLSKELLEENEVNLMLLNILEESDNDEDDDDADKTWASSTSNSTKPESFTQSNTTGRSVAIGDLLVGSMGHNVNSSPKSLNPWRVEMTTARNASNGRTEQNSAADLLHWGDVSSTRIW